jgi:hypothetical protein
LGTHLSAQSISLYTINTGGGYNNTLEWSIGESVSIANFTSAGYSLNTGVLQPMSSLSTGIVEPIVYGYQITIGPNPTYNLLHIKSNFNQSGNLSFQLIDSKSAIVLTQDAGFIFNTYEKDFYLNELSSGVYYMKVYFKPISGIAKTGIYKIIKL